MTTTINNEHKKLNVPNLRFPEFEEWEKCKLGNITEFSKERINTQSLSCDNYVATENMLQDYQGVVIASSVPSETNVIKYNNGDILFSNIRPYLKKVWLADRNGGCSADVFVFKALSTCIPDFLHYVIANDRFINFVMSGAKGVKMPRGDKEQMKTYNVGVPSIAEQKKIAKLFALLDERITTQSKVIDKLQSLIKGLNNYLYQQYGNSVETSFDDLGVSYSGLSGKSASDFGSGKPFITYLNVYSNDVIDETSYQYVQIGNKEKQNVVWYGDVLFTLSSETPEEVGIGSVYLGNQDVYLNSFCFGVHITNTQKAFSPYLSYYISTNQFRRFIYPFAQGSTRFNLCKADFEKASFILPALENQKRIYKYLKALSDKIVVEIATLEQYNYQKQYLLRQMFI